MDLLATGLNRRHIHVLVLNRSGGCSLFEIPLIGVVQLVGLVKARRRFVYLAGKARELGILRVFLLLLLVLKLA